MQSDAEERARRPAWRERIGVPRMWRGNRPSELDRRLKSWGGRRLRGRLGSAPVVDPARIACCGTCAGGWVDARTRGRGEAGLFATAANRRLAVRQPTSSSDSTRPGPSSRHHRADTIRQERDTVTSDGEFPAEIRMQNEFYFLFICWLSLQQSACRWLRTSENIIRGPKPRRNSQIVLR